MGGVGRKNRKKAEKAKVQLKKPKTAPGKHLPKGTNVTKTEFKVGKIVIPKQLERSAADKSGPLTKKKLGLKEVLGKLGHFSQAARNDALDGLKELVTGLSGGNLVAEHLNELVTKLCPLVSDRETKVRRSGLALLEAVIRQAESKRLEPLYNILSAHLSCSLTHIDPGIQRDALKLIDSLTQMCPAFIAANYIRLLPDCLEQISAKKASGSGVSLANNLSAKLTAVQWRIDVLKRVDDILQAVIDRASSGSGDNGRSRVDGIRQLDFRPNLHAGLYAVRTIDGFSLSELARIDRLSKSGSVLLPILERTLPLIIETMVEASALGQRPGFLLREVSPLLTSSAGILEKLLVLAAGHKGNACLAVVGADNDSIRLVRDKYFEDLLSRIIGNVPYSSPEGKCHQQNLQLCSLYLTLAVHVDPQFLRKIIQTLDSTHQASFSSIKLQVYQQLLLSQQLDRPEKNQLLQSLIDPDKTSSASSKERIRKAEFLCQLLNEDDLDLSSWILSIPSQVVKLTDDDDGDEALQLLSVLLQYSLRGKSEHIRNLLSYEAQLKDWTLRLKDVDWMSEATRQLEFIFHNLKSWQTARM